MKQIKKKLHSNAGASIILALALMLICVMVSSVIVAAAASGVNRNETELKKQQQYLAITSAAQYIAEELNKTGSDKFCGVNLVHEKACSRYKNYAQQVVRVGENDLKVYAIPTPYASLVGGGLELVDIMQFYLHVPDTATEPIFCDVPSKKIVLDESGETSFSGTFSGIMKEAATKVYTGAEVPYSREFTIEVDDTRISEVKCIFEMDENYHVSVLVKSEDGGSEYSMIVDLPVAGHIENPTGYQETEECEHYCFYEYTDLYGNVQVTPPGLSTFKQQVDNTTTTITWGTPVISKGGN